MLVSSNFKKDDVITIKTILGEEIICTYVSEDTEEYTISDPYVLANSPQGMGLMPPVFSGNELKGEMPFAKSQKMWITSTRDDIAVAYKSKVTGIQQVSRPSIITS